MSAKTDAPAPSKGSPPEFDQFAERYGDIVARSLRITGYPPDHFSERKAREIRETLEESGRAERPLRLLNFGCGVGASEPHLVRCLPAAEVFSTDISERSIAEAKRRLQGLPRVQFRVQEGAQVPFAGPFDVILVAGVLHHVPSHERDATLATLRGVLAEDGFLFLFEQNPWNPVTRWIVANCPLDEKATLLSAGAAARLLRHAGFAQVTVRYIHFFPAVLRPLEALEPRLRALPLGAQYYCVARPDGGTARSRAETPP